MGLKVAAKCEDMAPQHLWVKEQSSSAAFAGCILGQMCMGYLGDVVGRSRALSMTLGLAAVSALFSAVAPWGSANTAYAIVVAARFLIGFGLGGVYPLSAASAAEATTAANQDDKEEKTASVVRTSRAFFWQGPGAMAPYIVAILLRSVLQNQGNCYQWRVLLGVGAIPALAVVWLSRDDGGGKAAAFEEESPERALLGDDAPPRELLARSGRTNALLLADLRLWPTWKKVLGTSLSWLLFDVSFYGLTLMGPDVVSAVFEADESIERAAAQQLAAIACAIPGTLLTVELLKRGVSCKTLQLAGFYLAAAALAAFAALRIALKDRPALVFLSYCFVYFALSFGPAVTTFVLPAAVFPAAYRSTLNGVAAASGKLGAVLGTEIFPALKTRAGLNYVLYASAALSILGAAVTHVFIERGSARANDAAQ
mmetsp:Transcript_19710/g.67670  ORF Transcript_19710/g.67670 Transcript_19710/m.67670 type:complete len:426 (+) Transcript_19710:517-1794(+)